MSRARAWCITINNPTEEDHDNLTGLDYDYLIYQIEQGESGTVHIQAYVYSKNKLCFTHLREELPGAHLEIARGSIQSNVDYCSKSDTRLDGPYTFGIKPEQGRRTDLQNITVSIKSGASIRDVLLSDDCKHIRHEKFIYRIANLLGTPRTRSESTEVYILWGEPGVGKTRPVYDYFEDSVYQVPYVHGSRWYDGYTSQQCLLYDDWPVHLDDRDGIYNHLLAVTDRYPVMLPIKGGFVSLNKCVVVFTSNFCPASWFNGVGLRALERRIKKIIHVGCIDVVCSHNVHVVTWVHGYNV